MLDRVGERHTDAVAPDETIASTFDALPESEVGN